jgi:opacity protein-like surface antigen
MKKTLLSLFMLLASSQVFAFSNGSGIYAGALFGLQNPVMKQKLTQTIEAGDVYLQLKYNGNGNTINSSIGIDLGYGYFWNRFYAGIEVEKYFKDTHISTTFLKERTDLFTSNLHIHNYFRASVHPGYLLARNTLAFATLGISYDRLSLHADLNHLPYSHAKSKVGIECGLGVMQQLCKYLVARLEYTYVDYRNFQANGVFGDEGAVVTMHNHGSIHTNSLLFGLSYYLPINAKEMNRALFSHFPHSGRNARFNGFYTGLAPNLVANTIKQTITIRHLKSFQVFNGNNTQIDGNINAYLGYGHQWRKFYLGLQFNGEILTTAVHSDPLASQGEVPPFGPFTGDISSKLSVRNYCGFEIKPGYLITRSLLLYGILGVDASKLHWKTHFTRIEGAIATEFDYQKKRTTFSPLFGAGIEKKLTAHFSLFANYVYTRYQNFSYGRVFFDAFPEEFKTIKTSGSAHSNLGSIGADYRF